MELHQALRHAIKAEGQDIVTDLRLVNIFNEVYVVDKDYRADLIVYKTDKSYRAKSSENNGIWYFCSTPSQADKKIFFVDKDYRADLKVYFTDKEYRAGWRKNDKKHLMY